MTPRRKRLAIVGGVLLALAAATALVLNAFRSNLVFFFTPTQVATGEAPVQRPFRLGGLVRTGSVARDGVQVRFVVTDTQREVIVAYTGPLPDLFKEGKGVVAQGSLGADGVFVAREVLAKHDENYMPPEAAEALKRAQGNSPSETQRATPNASIPLGDGTPQGSVPSGPVPAPTLVEAKR